MSTTQLESKRIRQFRLELCKQIPKFPNDRETLNVLEGKSLGSLLVAYANWTYRLVSPRPRSISIEPALTADRRWKRLAADTKILLRKAGDGDNLNAHLSLRATRNGFTPKSSETAPTTDKWEDKDFVLNVMGYHHFHLSQSIEPAGHTKRTDDVLFAQITRTTFTAIGFFDHSVFDPTDPASHTMTAERDRLWRLTEERKNRGRPPGVYIDHLITTSGHSLHHTNLAANFSRLIHSIDPKLDDLTLRSEVFPKTPHEVVKAMKLMWRLNYLDLGLFDKTTSTFFILQPGPI